MSNDRQLIEKHLTIEDLDIIIESVESWIKGDSGTNLLIDIMTDSLTPKDQLNSESYKLSKRESADKIQREKNIRNEKGTILKAKLMILRREILEGTL